MKYYIFKYLAQDGYSYTAVFDDRPLLDEDELAAELKLFHDGSGVSQRLIYIYPQLHLAAKDLAISVAGAANMITDEIITVPYNSLGVVDKSQISDECLNHGMHQIIKSRNLILQSDNTFHYVNPSGKHSPYFIRTGNILEKSEEINFIALQLLQYIDDELTEIQCDTASILILVYAANYLRSLFDHRLSIPFATFSSYTNIATIKKGALVIISASSSGDLEDKIYVVNPDCIVVTVIFNKENTQRPNKAVSRRFLFNPNSVLKDLLVDYVHIKQYSLDNCHYCSHNSTPVEVRTDQFIPSKVVIRESIIRINHVPSWFKTAVSELTCRNFIYVNRAETYNDKVREFSLT